MSEKIPCLRQLAAAGVEAPGRRVGIEIRDGSVLDLRICAACVNVGRFAMEHITTTSEGNDARAGIFYPPGAPEMGKNCAQAAKNMKLLLANLAAKNAAMAARTELLALPVPGQLEATTVPTLAGYLSIEALAVQIMAQAESQPPQLTPPQEVLA